MMEEGESLHKTDKHLKGFCPMRWEFSSHACGKMAYAVVLIDSMSHGHVCVCVFVGSINVEKSYIQRSKYIHVNT